MVSRRKSCFWQKILTELENKMFSCTTITQLLRNYVLHLLSPDLDEILRLVSGKSTQEKMPIVPLQDQISFTSTKIGSESFTRWLVRSPSPSLPLLTFAPFAPPPVLPLLPFTPFAPFCPFTPFALPHPLLLPFAPICPLHSPSLPFTPFAYDGDT